MGAPPSAIAARTHNRSFVFVVVFISFAPLHLTDRPVGATGVDVTVECGRDGQEGPAGDPPSNPHRSLPPSPP